MIAVLCGGVGAAKFLNGLVDVIDPAEVTAIVNTGDDALLYGLSISPDLDTVTYTLSGRVNPETGWGIAGDTFRAMEALRALGDPAWFALGDVDLATHLYRTRRLGDGATLTGVTAELAESFDLRLRLLPMSDDPVRTRLRLVDGDEVAFQEYFVKLRHSVAVSAVRYEGAENSRPAPGVLQALRAADAVVIAPSNPVLSIGPILAVPGIAEALRARRSSVGAISPIVGGAALRGPADRLLTELGEEASAAGVARVLSPVASVLVVDDVDRELQQQIEAAGMRCVVTSTVMIDRQASAALARDVLAALRPGA